MQKSFQILPLLLMILVSCNNNKPEQNIENQGKVKQETVSVAPKIAGRIQEIKVSEGQQVYKGDTLAILDVPEISSKLQQAEGAIESARGQLNLALNGATSEQLDQLQGQLDAATAQLQFAEQSFHRMKNMYEDSLVPAQQFDEVQSKYKAANAQVQALQAKKLEVVKGTRPETIISARGQVERAVGAKNEVLQAAKERFIIAPADMTIESIALKNGELATPGYTIFNGYQTSSTYFRFTISESRINAFHVGLTATVKVPYTEKVIKGKIASVKQLPRYADNTSTSPNYKIGESIFELKVVPINESDASGLYANSTVLLNPNPAP
ncbi:biotin/lipoyl-binding protein [Chitinophagaceae bacterium LB-8]|uniref:Biotin/lipoyl-binding protein n=1 Tax=Paraflavisolibacter caeni TaxID=2982496 RepID=A0A9X3BK14_9BACT|nr:biotin/lipoyl-binding protein [Paraflavisolibacter caeni]MCU7551993.1 biotin/lipoyl-binding protein [Paraflavisolibacter caeni]